MRPVVVAAGREPYGEGVLTRPRSRETAASIAAMQEPDGRDPWTAASTPTSGTTSRPPWRWSSAGSSRPPSAPTAGCARTQRHDGSWPMSSSPAGQGPQRETNMSAYLAVGVWHHWLVRRDEAFVRGMWPVVRRALDSVVGLQLPFGGIAWSGVARRPARHGQRGRPARRLLEHLPEPARRRRAGGAGRRAAAGLGAGRRPARARAAPPTATCSSTSPSSPWTGTTRCSAARSAATPAARCSTSAGTPSSSRAWASAASRATRGSPGPRPASW